jgi:hypothetical protein
MRVTEVGIERSCPENWAQMQPGPTSRFCERCTKHVHDLSAMTRAQAREVLSRREQEDLCVRYLRDEQGRIALRRPDVLPAASLRRARLRPAAALVLVLAACTSSKPPKKFVEDMGPAPRLKNPPPAAASQGDADQKADPDPRAMLDPH